MPTVTVVVPVYNVEKYLQQCIDSILAQTYSDFELILVDDGSEDKCPEICNDYAMKDERVCVLHKENGGQSEARNMGIDIAKGEYIAFIDSDDVVSPLYLDRLIDALQNSEADISGCGIISFEDGNTFEFNDSDSSVYDLVEGRKICLDYYQLKWPMIVGPIGKLYRKCLFENIRFPKGKIYEDQGTIPRLWYLSKKVAVIRDGNYYGYRIRKGSTSHSDFSRRVFEDVWNVELCRTFFVEQSDYEMEEHCARFMRILQAKYIVLAYHNHAVDQIPKQYQMRLQKALALLRKEINDSTYTWYLSLVYPKLAVIHPYVTKIEKLIGFTEKTKRSTG